MQTFLASQPRAEKHAVYGLAELISNDAPELPEEQIFVKFLELLIELSNSGVIVLSA